MLEFYAQVLIVNTDWQERKSNCVTLQSLGPKSFIIVAVVARIPQVDS